MSDLPERFKFEKRYYYPHMKPADIAIWERFIEAHPDYFDTCEYDVAVGAGAKFDTEVNPESGGNASALYKRKIDVVAYKKDKIFVVEVKPNAGTSAIGQVLGYKLLFVSDYLPFKEPIAVLISDRFDRDTAQMAANYEVKLIAV